MHTRLNVKKRMNNEHHEYKVSILEFPNSNCGHSLHGERARWNTVRRKNSPMRHPTGAFEKGKGSSLRKIITQIKTARNVARVALDHLSHNF